MQQQQQLCHCPLSACNNNVAPVISHQQTLSRYKEDDNDGITIEDLMYKYKSDKSRDDHGYTKLYNLIFSSMRMSVQNITEVGVAAGQSIQAWYRYFPLADIHGFDLTYHSDKVKTNLEYLKPRVHTHIPMDILKTPNLTSSIGFVPESMDIIIDDGPHTFESQEGFLLRLFPYLKPGGLYIIEDVGHGKGQGMVPFHDHPESMLKEQTRQVLEKNDAIWVDTAMGHRDWPEWVRRVGRMWAANRTHHNSYCVVIQKRTKPLLNTQMNYGNGAMNPDSIIEE